MQRDQRYRGHSQPDDSENHADDSINAPPPRRAGARCDTGVRLMGADMCQTSIPSRRAERCRCRPARSRRSRLTSSGSTASAAGASMSVFSTW